MKSLVRLFALSAATLAAQSVTINSAPSREFGQPILPPSTSPFQLSSTKENFVEGRELSAPTSVAFDNSVSPPIVYVVDTFNNRVLAWRNATNINKANFADLVIGQSSLQSTSVGGPGTPLSTGLTLPTAAVVDSKGNLYVADSGNNRIVRYPAPFNQTSQLLPVDLVIGQKSINSGNSANEGSPILTQKGLFLSNGTLLTIGMVLDAQGNLWVTDAGNNRVLRFPVGNLNPGTSEPPADLVLGQNDFSSSQPPPGFTQRSKSNLVQPGGLAFDQNGRLYVSDNVARVLQYSPPFVNGTNAVRILGVAQVQQGQTITYPTNYTLGSPSSSPSGLFTIGNNLFVCDTPQSRIVRYDVPENWPQESTNTFSPPSLTVIGQTSSTVGKPNQGLNTPSAFSFAIPAGGAVLNNGAEIWIADTGNNRVVALPQNGGNQTFGSATRVLGQLDYIYGASNLVEGRELFLRSSSFSAGGVVVDKNSNPPRLYVADTFNNRILGFKDARLVGTDARNVLTQKADLVIGQPDLFTTAVNYPSTDPTQTNDSGLNGPIGLVVDAAGNLYVTDYGNSRILRFPSPFSQSPGALQHANLVLGQSSFSGLKITDPSSGTMSGPWGLALFSDGSIAASDVTHNRVLLFKKSSGDFTNGQAAATVFGQPTFTTTLPGGGTGSFSAPRHIASDTSDRLYVADASNNRMVVFTRATTASSGTGSAFQLTGLSGPQGVAVSTLTGEIYVANTSANQVFRYPEFQTLQLNGATPTATLGSFGPLTLALDAFDNVVVLEAANRMTFYYSSLSYRHAAAYNQKPMAPGMLSILFLGAVDNSAGNTFTGIANASATAYPWPTSLSDVQILVNGIQATIYQVLNGLIYFQVPANAPCGCNGEASTADFIVSRPSSGQILAANTFFMAQSSPGFFTSNAAGTGQIAAGNDDNSANSPSNQISRGKTITLYLTGQGRVPGMPADGTPPAGAVPIPNPTSVLMNPGPAGALPASAVIYSGLSPSFPGGWQINVTIPQTVPPSNVVKVVAILNDIQSNIGPGNANASIVTTIAVK